MLINGYWEAGYRFGKNTDNMLHNAATPPEHQYSGRQCNKCQPT